MQNATRQTPTWSNLPSDVLIFIMENLSYVDQIYFRAVCKNWRFDIHGVIKYSDKMSWIFRVGRRSYKEYDSFGYLFDPTYKRKYIIESEVLDGAKAYASKYGWLLLAKETEYTLFFYLYCPFTNQVIQLPEFKVKMNKKYRCYDIKATFSAAPTSSDCVICLALTRGRYIYRRLPHYKHKFILSTCSPGDDSWNMASFYTSNEMEFYGATCVRGVFYFIGADQDELIHIEIGVYKPATQEWKTYEGPYFSYRLSFYGSYLIDESCDDGELLIVYNEIGDRFDAWQWHVFRFDLSEMNWRKVESLGDRMLFLGLTSTSMRGGELANTIHEAVGYYPRDYYCSSKFYEASKSQLCPQIYDWIEEKGLPIIWVQPPEIGMRNRSNNPSPCSF